MARVRLRLLGSAERIVRGQAVMLERKDAALLAYLALEGSTSRAVLAGLLWPDTPESQARTNLRKRLSRLREQGLLEGEDPVTLHDGVELDVQPAPAGQVALEADPGELLAGLDVSDCPDLAEWLLVWRERLREQHINRLDAEARRLEMASQLDAALEVARHLLVLEPHAEVAYRRLMRLHYLLGDRAAALETFRRCREVLQREFGVEPLPETLELAEQIEGSGLSVPHEARPTMPLEVLRPPLVGREPEWARLQAAWARAQVALVVGGAGMGKTRLLTDFAASHGGQRPVLRAAGRPGERDVPHAATVRLIRAALQVANPDDVPAWARAELSRVVPERFTGGGSDAPSRLTEACAALIECAAPAALVLDDLHFWDAEGMRVAVFLASRFAGEVTAPRVLMACRPDELPASSQNVLNELLESGLHETGLAVTVSLGPLPHQAVRALLHELKLGSGLDDRVYSLTGGNALYVTEALQGLFETGDLAPAERAGGMIARRLERLSDPTKRLLWALVLSGGELELELAGAMLERDPLDLAPAVAELEAAHVLRTGMIGHDLIAQVARQSMPDAVRVLLHRRAATYLAPDGPARAATHWFEAGETVRAVEQWQRAAHELTARGLPHEAARLTERALEHATSQRQPGLRVDLARLLLETARYDEARVLLAAVPEVRDPGLRARVIGVEAQLLRLEGKLEDALTVIAEGQRLAAHLNDETLRFDLYSQELEIAYLQGRYEDALERSKTELTRLRESPPGTRLAQVLSNLGALSCQLGRYDTALLYHHEALSVAQHLGSQKEQFQALNNLAATYGPMNQLEQALDYTNRALALEHFDGRDVARGNQAALLMMLGRYEEAIHATESLAREASQIEERVYSLARLAELFALTHRDHQIDAVLTEAMNIVQHTSLSGPKARLVLNALKFGSADVQTRARAWLEHLDLSVVPYSMRAELEGFLEP
jgi:DNA-binding SARP family transcriptional activator